MLFVFFFLRTGWVGPLVFISGLLFLFLYFFFYIGALTSLMLLIFKNVTLCDSSKLVLGARNKVKRKMWPIAIMEKSVALSFAKKKISRKRRLLPTDWSPGGDRNALTEDKGSSRKYFSARLTTSANWRCAKISLPMVTSFIILQPGSKLHSMMTASRVNWYDKARKSWSHSTHRSHPISPLTVSIPVGSSVSLSVGLFTQSI